MVQRFMAYIVDFTIIMQIIFGLMVNARLRLSRRLIKLAFKTYSDSEGMSKVHKEIKEHVKKAARFGRDAALEKTIQLIKDYQLKPESMEELQSAMKTFKNNEDEDWGLGKAWLHRSITHVLIKALLSECKCHYKNEPRSWCAGERIQVCH